MIWNETPYRARWLQRLWLLVLLGLFLPRGVQAAEWWWAERVVLDTPVPPDPNDPNWRRIELPHALFHDDPKATGAWFRFRIPAASSPEPQGVFLWWLNQNAAFYFNGSHIGDGGPLSEPLARSWNRPCYFTLPSALWRPGANELLIHLRSEPGWGILSPLSIGPTRELHRVVEWNRFLRVDLTRGLMIALLLASSLALSVWWWRRTDSQYLWFGLACLGWSGFSFYMSVQESLLPPGLMRWLVHFSCDAWVAFLILFVLSHLGLPSRLVERLLACFLLVVAIVSLPHGLFWQGKGFLFNHTVSMLAVLVLTVRLRRHWRSHRLLGACLCVLLMAGLRDLVLGLPPRLLPTWLSQMQVKYRVLALHYAAPVVLLVLTRNLARRFVQSMQETELLNQELESRVEAGRKALEESYARHAQMEREAAALAERDRIFRDLHDDIGAKLLSLIIRAKDGQDADTARSALRSLRDVVSCAAPTEKPLGDLLADWRAEIEERVTEAGLSLSWEQDERLSSVEVAAAAALNLGRILREAVSNVLRHAEATQVRIHFRAGNGAYLLTVADDGKGGGPGGALGRGIRNMQGRAAMLGGGIRWDWRADGCSVVLEVPEPQLGSSD